MTEFYEMFLKLNIPSGIFLEERDRESESQKLINKH
jgi:hypothetical protein